MGKKIMLVDDDEICHFIHAKMIQLHCKDCEIQTASNGADALIKLGVHLASPDSLPDLILLDLNMPVMDGFEFLERFQQLQIDSKERVNIVVLTSSMRVDDIVRASSLGIHKFLSKPLSDQDASAMVSNLKN